MIESQLGNQNTTLKGVGVGVRVYMIPLTQWTLSNEYACDSLLPPTDTALASNNCRITSTDDATIDKQAGKSRVVNS